MALPENEVLFHIRFCDKKCYLEQIRDGVLSFSCPGKYIEIAELTGNNKQGDLLEAVFARLRKGNHKILEMRDLLGDDLEEIDDGDYVYLRRNSSKLIPTFCTYGYSVGKVYRDGNHYNKGRHNICFRPDPQMYEGFSKKDECTHKYIALIKKDTYFKNILASCKKTNTKLAMASVVYLDMTKEFFIEPTDIYPEIFIKSSVYSYQEEYRLVFPDKRLTNTDERFPFHITRFAENEIYFLDYEFGFQAEFSLEFNDSGQVVSI